MATIKAEWVFSIVKALEARLEFANDGNLSDEEPVIKEALNFFKAIQLSLSND